MVLEARVITTEMKDAMISPNIMCSYWKIHSFLWFSSPTHHLRTQVARRVVVSVNTASKRSVTCCGALQLWQDSSVPGPCAEGHLPDNVAATRGAVADIGRGEIFPDE